MLFIVRALSKTWRCRLSGDRAERLEPTNVEHRTRTAHPHLSEDTGRTVQGKRNCLSPVNWKYKNLTVTRIKRSIIIIIIILLPTEFACFVKCKDELPTAFEIAPFIPEENICRGVSAYFLKEGGCFEKVIRMKEFEVSKYACAEWRSHQKHARVILHPCFSFNQQPPFLAQQRGECNKMRLIHPQSCMCTLQGSTVVHTWTEEWQLPWPQIVS